MPKRKDLKKILVVGAGPIIIGQACEFDYSGTQACKALRDEGFKVILINSNPATIMTDPDVADKTYIEPITLEVLEKILKKEKPDAILPTMGGQTALNLAMEAEKKGILRKYKIELIGANSKAIANAEDRKKFRKNMIDIGLDLPKSEIVNKYNQASKVLKKIGLPAIIRPAFTLGGLGGALGEVGKVLKKDTGQAELLGRSVVGSSILNLAGFGLSPEAILARGAGIIPNSNLQLLFNAPTLRAFRFNWKMSPRSQDEAIRINNIIRFFKQGMAVKRRMGSGAGGRSYFLATPNVFDITFRTSKTNREITNENNAVLRMKTCACVGAAVNYTPQGMWNAYEKGQPTSCILSLQFKELEPVYNTDYEEDPFEYEDLTGFVPENAVGY